MKQFLFILLVGTVSIVFSGCGGEAKNTAQSETKQAEPAPVEPFDLMEYSALDTNSGVFYGEYDEKVDDDITVKVGLEVELKDGVITRITLLDTAWVHPNAAIQMPGRIIEQQKLPVDAVTGASVASWSIMTATAIALEIDLMLLEDLEDESDEIDFEEISQE